MKTDEKNPVFDIRDTLEKYACIYRNTTLKIFSTVRRRTHMNVWMNT